MFIIEKNRLVNSTFPLPLTAHVQQRSIKARNRRNEVVQETMMQCHLWIYMALATLLVAPLKQAQGPLPHSVPIKILVISYKDNNMGPEAGMAWQ